MTKEAVCLLYTVSKVSLIFQREDNPVPTVTAKLETATLMLTSVEDEDGFHTQEFAAEHTGICC